MGISIETYEGSGIRMKWFRFGKGDRPIVIIPGLSVQSVMGSSEQIAEAYSTLSEDFCIYVFDRKEDVTEGYSIREMAEDTVHVIRALGLSDICLFGASQGGMISLCIAIYPSVHLFPPPTLNALSSWHHPSKDLMSSLNLQRSDVPS